MKKHKSVVDFFFEAGILGKTPRSWTFFSGSKTRNIAEHTNRVAYIGYAMAKLEGKADPSKVVMMCLFHDFAEARTSDLNYVHQKYVKADETAAIEDFTKNLPFGADIKNILDEYHERKSIESRLAKDADRVEWLMTVKEENDLGNKIVDDLWLNTAYKRIETPLAKELANVILKTKSDEWWRGDRNDEWWVTRNKTAKTKSTKNEKTKPKSIRS